MPGFLIDVEEIRRRAAQKIDEGPVTETYEGDLDKTMSLLNDALATEIVCVLRYMHHYFMATGVHGMAVRDEFKEHADAEREHADKIADRIQQLGGRPDYNPASLVQRSASQYVEGTSLGDMIKEDLIAERIVIEVYQQMIRHFADHDPTTRVMIEHILRDEEEHAADLSDLLYIVDPHTGKTEGEDPGTHPLDMHHDEQSRQQHGKQNSRSKPEGKGVVTRPSQYSGQEEAEEEDEGNGNRSASNRQKTSHHRELDVPATPRQGGGEKQPQQPNLRGTRNREGIDADLLGRPDLFGQGEQDPH